jgi:hypothetical protein
MNNNGVDPTELTTMQIWGEQASAAEAVEVSGMGKIIASHLVT